MVEFLLLACHDTAEAFYADSLAELDRLGALLAGDPAAVCDAPLDPADCSPCPACGTMLAPEEAIGPVAPDHPDPAGTAMRRRRVGAILANSAWAAYQEELGAVAGDPDAVEKIIERIVCRAGQLTKFIDARTAKDAEHEVERQTRVERRRELAEQYGHIPEPGSYLHPDNDPQPGRRW